MKLVISSTVWRKAFGIAMALAVYLGTAIVCEAQVTNLNFNSLPSAQGWSFLSSCPAPENSLFLVSGNVLHQNTLGCAESASYYTKDGVVTGDPFTVTVTARVVTDEVFTDTLGGRPEADGHIGASFGVEFGSQEYYIGIGPGYIDGLLSSGLEVLSTNIDTTQFHTYVLHGTPATGIFTLSVDGVQITSSSVFSSASSANDVFLGDGSSAANAQAEYSGYTFQNGSGPLFSVCPLYDATRAVRSGSTIPIKLQLCDAQGNDLSSPSIVAHASDITQVSTSTSGLVQDSGNSNPDSNFRFDSGLGSTGGYIFNLKTTGLSTGTYNLNFIVTGDSSSYIAPFQVR
jgi:hypothetical protein